MINPEAVSELLRKKLDECRQEKEDNFPGRDPMPNTDFGYGFYAGIITGLEFAISIVEEES